ncbi:class I SAM-dependent methyltransferase [Candidatus Pelagibacter sp.]|nr:class I SAM-dependent methyltransferase [Candidatus Pelagibacter sp.]
MKKKKLNSWENIYSNNHSYRNHYPYDEVVSFIKSNFKDKLNKKILEIGCGTGNNISFLAENGFDAYGFDASKTAIEYAKKKLKQKKLISNVFVNTFNNYKYKKTFFDAVIDRSSLTFGDMVTVKKTIKKIHTCLKKGGLFFFTPFSDDSSRFSGAQDKKGLFVPKFLPLGGPDKRGLGVSFLSKKDIFSLFPANLWEIKNFYLRKNINIKNNFNFSYFQVELKKK